MFRLGYLSLEGLRVDGRRPDEPRHISADLEADGRVVYRQGNTTVVALVDGPRQSLRGGDGEVIVEVKVAPFSGLERVYVGSRSRRVTRLERILHGILEEVLLLELYPKTSLRVAVEVLSDDGGVVAAAVNAVNVALVGAGVPMKDQVVACSSGFLESTCVIDLCRAEYAARGPELVLGIMPNHPEENVLLLEMKSKLPAERLAEVVNAAMEGCTQIHNTIEAIVKKHVFRRVHIPVE